MSDEIIPVLQPADEVQPLQLSYVSLAGEEVPAATRENAHLLQLAADHEVSTRNLRRSGIGDIVWGLVCCGLGATLFRANYLNIGLILLGLILISVGIWITYRPSPIGLIFDGVTLLLVAGWNIMINVMVMSNGGRTTAGSGPVIAIFQIIWGINRLKKYPRFANAASMQPSTNTLRWLGQLTKATLKANPKTETNAVEFQKGGQKWKGRLMPEIAIFAMKIGSFGGYVDAIVISQDGITINNVRKRTVGKKFRANLIIGQRTMNIVIPPASLQRLQNWMSAQPVASHAIAAMSV